MKKKILIFTIILHLQFLMVTHAQNGYTVSHYTGDNGLPQNSIRRIAVDGYGFIWLATEDGLVRFDGHRFYVFNGSNLGVKNNRVADIEPYGRWMNPSTASTSPNVRTMKSYAHFYSDEAVRIENGKAVREKVYFLDEQKKLLTPNPSLHTISHLKGLPDWYAKNSNTKRFLISSGNWDGHFFVKDNTRLTYYKEYRKQYELNFEAPETGEYFSLNERLYYFHGESMFNKIYNKKITTFSLAGDILQDSDFKSPERNLKLYWNKNCEQAFFSLNKNLYVLEPQKDGNLTTKLLIEGFDFDLLGIEVIYSDKQSGKVYLGSTINGLFILTRQYFRTLTKEAGGEGNVFYAQLPYQQNHVLTPTGIILGQDNASNRIIEKRSPAIENVNSLDKRSIVRDKNEAIWIKKNENLIKLDSTGLIINKSWRLKSQIRSLHVGKDGLVWVGTDYNGLYQVDPDASALTLRHLDIGTLPAVTYIESLDSRFILVGTISGLYHVDLTIKKSRLIQSTKDMYIKSIHPADKDRVWITVQGKGLMLMNGEGMLTTFPLDKNKYLASLHCVVDDGRGYLWIPTNKGLFQMAILDLLAYAKRMKAKGNASGDVEPNLQSELYYQYYSMEDGFNTNEFNGSCQPCGLKLGNGYISLPSLNGLVWFRPEQIKQEITTNPIILDKVELGNQLIQTSGDTIIFPINPENINFYLATPYFGKDYNLNLSYALVKENKEVRLSDWLPLNSSEFKISYSSLKSGNYTLLIRKQNGFGIDKYLIKKFYIQIPPSWEETYLAKFAFFLVLASAIYFYNVYRLRSIIRQNARLEEIILTRTSALDKSMKELEVSKNQMSQQIHIFSRLLASISHDVQSPLRFISLTSQTVDKMLENDEVENISKVASIITDLTTRMSAMLQDLSDYIKFQVYGNNMNFEPINLRSLVDSKLGLFKNVIEHNGNIFSNDTSKEAIIISDYQLLSVVIHNLIDNAAKYSYNGEIRIFSRVYGNGQIELVISNTGSGLPQEIIELINQSKIKKNTDKHILNTKGLKGLGLLIVKDVSELVGITIKVSQTDVTNFHLYFE